MSRRHAALSQCWKEFGLLDFPKACILYTYIYIIYLYKYILIRLRPATSVASVQTGNLLMRNSDGSTTDTLKTAGEVWLPFCAVSGKVVQMNKEALESKHKEFDT